MNKWHKRYFELANVVASWSNDPSTKIGAVIVGNKGQIISQGYNGFPRGIADDERYHDRETKYRYVVHAEANAIYNAIHNGASVYECSMYITGLPVCHECAKAIIQCGIKNVFIDTQANERWNESTDLAIKMFEEVGLHYEFLEK